MVGPRVTHNFTATAAREALSFHGTAPKLRLHLIRRNRAEAAEAVGVRRHFLVRQYELRFLCVHACTFACVELRKRNGAGAACVYCLAEFRLRGRSFAGGERSFCNQLAAGPVIGG